MSWGLRVRNHTAINSAIISAWGIDMLPVRRLRQAALCAGLVASGCTGPSIWEPLPQSNFAYPNSNVIPLQHTQGTVSRSYIAPFQTPVLNDAALMQDAIDQAVHNGGGDLLIDGSHSVQSTIVPLLFITVYTEKVTVDGTAAKMEVGKRALH